jgi:tetratricopeptide (TPR) repeat protein
MLVHNCGHARQGIRKPAYSLSLVLFLILISPIACRSGGSQTLLEVPIPPSEDLDPEINELIAEAKKDLDRALTYVGKNAEERQAKAYGYLGKVLYANYFWTESEPAFENARIIDPENPSWAYYLGALREKEGRLDEALSDFRESLMLLPDNLPARIHESKILFEMGDFEETESRLKALASEAPETAYLLELQGDLATVKEETASAIEHYLAALEMQPTANSLHYKLALAYRDLGNEVKHQEHLQERGDSGVRLKDPLLEELLYLRRGAQAYLLLGSYLMDSGQYEEARQYIERSLRSDPENEIALNALGRTRLYLENPEGAREAFELAVETAPDDAESWFNLGMLISQTGRPEVAEENLTRAAELAPGDVNIQLGVANFYRVYQRCEMALPYFERAVSPQSEQLLDHLQYVLCLYDQGRYGDVVERLEDLHVRMPAEPNVAESLSRVLAVVPDPELRDEQRALSLAKSVFDAVSTADSMEAVAMASAAAGDYESALAWQERALVVIEDSGQSETLPLHYAEKVSNLHRFEAGLPAELPWPSFVLTTQ